MGKGQLAGIPNWLKEKIKKVETSVKGIETSLMDIAIPLLVTDWVANEDGTYSQAVTVNGLSGDAVPLIALSSVADVGTEDELYSYACISDVVTSENTITFIASKLPTISFTVVAKGVVAAENSAVADITALVGRVSELESELGGLVKTKDVLLAIDQNGYVTLPVTVDHALFSVIVYQGDNVSYYAMPRYNAAKTHYIVEVYDNDDVPLADTTAHFIIKYI